MLRHQGLVLFVALAVGAAACGKATEGVQSTPTDDQPAPGVLFADDFEGEVNGWDTGSDDAATIAYRDGEYSIGLDVSDLFVWGNAGQSGIGNAHLSVSVRNARLPSDAGFGVVCNYQDRDDFNYLGINADGYYAIVRISGDEHVFLTNGDGLWQFSDKIPVDAPVYQVEADCGADGTLRLSVNGQEIAAARDTPLPPGDVGLFVWSFELAPVEVRFDDLIVTPLPDR